MAIEDVAVAIAWPLPLFRVWGIGFMHTSKNAKLHTETAMPAGRATLPVKLSSVLATPNG